ncbi:hypothetical protein J582_0184 [Acinetobacter sp. 1566109]|nr:hypothetical protein J582_0184 [Acinetobacter sp. 1566109]
MLDCLIFIITGEPDEEIFICPYCWIWDRRLHIIDAKS